MIIRNISEENRGLFVKGCMGRSTTSIILPVMKWRKGEKLHSPARGKSACFATNSLVKTMK